MRRLILETIYRLAASGWVPRFLIAGPPPQLPSPIRKSGPIQLEIVSHCWRYSKLLTYQLSSLILHPFEKIQVRMTVFYCPEDEPTRRVLNFFSQRGNPNLTWNWQPLPKEQLFRRAIGRNQAALSTAADWIWFTDCDQVFHHGCIDALGDCLSGLDHILVFPRTVGCTQLLASDNPLLVPFNDGPTLVAIDPSMFSPKTHTRAIGPLQILRGDVARITGYCREIKLYQESSPRWQKTYEDRTFRWLLGTQGVPIDIPGLYRIEHVFKGRKRAG